LFHVVCLGQLAEIRRENGFVASLRSVRDQGALLILAHPHWCDNTMDDVLRWPFDGVEIYNHVCHWDNGKSSGLAHWNAALNRRSQALGFAADDTHLTQEHPGWNGGWIMVNARECTAPGIMDAIRRGNYYSSQGPEFYEISLSENELQLRFSPARFIRLVGPGPAGMRRGTYAGDLLTETRFTLPNEWRYLYAEIEDEHGHRAWTNHLLVQPE